MNQRLMPALLLALYLIPRFLFLQWYQSLPGLTGYYIEISYCILIAIVYTRSFHWKFKPDRKLYAFAGLNFLAGLLLYRLTRPLGFTVPFDLSSTETTLLLLLVAPLLEEFIFRQSLWVLLEKIYAQPLFAWLASSALFSLAHFVACFYVAPEYKAFVMYQALYTLVAGTCWGLARKNRNSFLAAVLLHATFNLGFYVANKISAAPASTYSTTSESAPSATTAIREGGILVVDMAVDPSVSPSKNINFLGGTGKAAHLPPATCAADLKLVEDFFSARLGLSTFNYESTHELEQRLRNAVLASHGLHTLGLVQRGIKNLSLSYFSMSASPEPKEGIQNFTQYIDNQIKNDMSELRSSIEKVKPSLVVVSSSDTMEENYEDLIAGGYDQETALKLSKDIIEAWKSEWSQLLTENKGTWFIVPAGNGGADWKGDLLVNDSALNSPIPAALNFSNLIRVSSYRSPLQGNANSCLSEFSNYGPDFVDISAPGERISSWAPCAAKSEVALTGTSQAAALAGNYFAQALDQGESIADAMKKLKKAPCLQNRIRFGYLE